MTDNNELMKLETNKITISGSIIPTVDSLFDIGSGDKKIRDIYVSSGSVWIGDEFNLSVSESTSGENQLVLNRGKNRNW